MPTLDNSARSFLQATYAPVAAKVCLYLDIFSQPLRLDLWNEHLKPDSLMKQKLDIALAKNFVETWNDAAQKNDERQKAGKPPLSHTESYPDFLGKDLPEWFKSAVPNRTLISSCGTVRKHRRVPQHSILSSSSGPYRAADKREVKRVPVA